MKLLNALLVVNICFSMLGGFYASDLLLQLAFDGRSVGSHRGLAVFSFAVTVCAGALALLLPYQPKFKVRMRKSGVDPDTGKAHKVELIFGDHLLSEDENSRSIK